MVRHEQRRGRWSERRGQPRFLVNISKGLSTDAVVRYVRLNGQPGIVLEEQGRATIAVVLDVIAGLVCGVRIVANPDKLEGISRKLGSRLADPPTVTDPPSASREPGPPMSTMPAEPPQTTRRCTFGVVG